jgi:hypothetical protein
MDESGKPPRFISLDFHLKFFPSLLWRLLHPKKRRYESTFAGPIRLERVAMAIVSMVMGIYGFSAVVGSGSVIGWGCGIAGLGGFSYLCIGSVRSSMGMRPSFEYFRGIIFFFFVILGINIGLEIGTIYHLSYGTRIIAVAAGFVLGYVAGIGGGLWVQRLGWIASLLDVLAIMGIAVMGLFDILLLTMT